MNRPHFNTDRFRADSAAGIAPNRPSAGDGPTAPRRSTLAGSEATSPPNSAANSAESEALRRPSGDLVEPAADDAARRLHCDFTPGARSWSC
jgi:hypothetical protein